MFDGIINAVKDFVPKFIGLLIAWIISTLIYLFFIREGGFETAALIHSIATLVAASLLTVLTLAALDNAK